MDLSSRKQEVLYAVVRDYILSAEPVGSVQVANMKGIHISPATVRSVMAELEERGFLRRPHASSGRIPTRHGYQFYVDQLMRLKPLTKDEQENIRKRVTEVPGNLATVVRDACRLISERAHRTGVALSPSAEERSLRHIQFMRLTESLLLVVLVEGSGIVENKILTVDGGITQDDLNRMHNYLNGCLTGRTIAKVRQEILLEMKRMQNEYDSMFTRALQLADQAISAVPRDMHIEGQSFLLSQPDFTDFDRMQKILRTLEERTLLMRLFDQSLSNPGVKILIGDESRFPEIDGLTLITSPYSDSEGNRGVLGVIGPTRMDYARIVPLVEFTSQMVTETLRSEVP